MGMVAGSILRLAQVTLLARILGPDAFGVIAVLMIVGDLSRLLSEAGLAEATIQRRTVSSEQQSTLYWLNLAFGVLVFVIIVGLAPLIERVFGFPELRELVSAVAFAVIFTAAGTQMQSMIRRNLDFGKMVFAANFSLFVGLCVMAVSVTVYAQGIWSFVWGVLAEAIVRLLILAVFAFRGGFLPGFHFSLRKVKGMLAFGGYRAGGMLANFFAGRADQILIGAFFSAASLGIYNLAYNFSSLPVKKINSVVTRVAFPAFSRLQDDRSRLREGYVSMIGYLSIVTAPLMAGLAGTAPVLVPFVFGEEWSEGVPLIQVVLLYAFIGALTGPVGTLIMGTGHANWSLYWNLAMLCVKPAVITIAALSGSVLVVAWALVGIACVSLPASYYFMIRKLIGNVFPAMLRRIGKPVTAALAMCVVLLAAAVPLQSLPPGVQLAVLIPAGGIVYLGLGVVMFREELRFILKAAWR